LAERGWLAAAAVWTAVLAAPGSAAADWYFTPFVGVKFRGTTTLTDSDFAASNTKPVLGGGVTWLGDGLLGAELEYSLLPGFFERNIQEPLVLNSRVQSLTGSLVVAAPLTLTRESLRPYVVAGMGWMGARSDGIPPIDELVKETMLALDLGAGAIGMLGERAGLRFDVRRFTNLDRDAPSGSSVGRPRLTFWRATVGVTLRY
jgi:hypothetical protein